MTHEAVVDLLEDVAKAIGDNVKFGYGALEDFNTIQNKSYPFIWLYALKGQFVPGEEGKLTSVVEFECTLNFLNLDNPKGAEYDTAQAWDTGFQIMEKYIHKLDEFLLASQEEDEDSITTDTVRITRSRFEAGRKATGDVLSGWTLDLTLEVPNDFDYCSIYD